MTRNRYKLSQQYSTLNFNPVEAKNVEIWPNRLKPNKQPWVFYSRSDGWGKDLDIAKLKEHSVVFQLESAVAIRKRNQFSKAFYDDKFRSIYEFSSKLQKTFFTTISKI